VDDVVIAANFGNKLGFHYERFWGDPPRFCMVQRSGIVIRLSQFDTPGSARRNRLADPNGEAWDPYVWIDDADSLCAEFKANGVKIPRVICDAISPTGVP
jgi:hypothetical protein